MTHTAAVLRNWNEGHKFKSQGRQVDLVVQDITGRLTTAKQELEGLLKQVREKETLIGQLGAQKIEAEDKRDQATGEGESHHELVIDWCAKHGEQLPPVPADYADPNLLADVSTTRVDPPGAPS